MPRPTLSLIAAVARRGAIGRDNQLLCRISEDLKFFKRTTLGSPVIMGRKTWDSIGRPLPGRRNIVITRNRQWQAEGVERTGSLDEALSLVQNAPKVFIIGGGEIYRQALPMADELVLTEIDADFEADAFFPEWDRTQFTSQASEPQTSEHGYPYRWVTYQRQHGA
ncbi:dihydrofolate reductase [Piscinibacter terrae]|uniref:Dihydrofolate reductase n=1 Tax=Piscinibacter terrae TaxID=2496871 RepID=A0A3N7HU89_9BURK|nr:dihydrofolate reductase [Albitalea terrae]RQP25897.1 dihydrofolate reductase [Albitalea terrae]